MDLADLALGQPRREVARHAGADEAALVAADGVEGQRRSVGCGFHDVAVRHEAELDERLEAVADAQHEAVAGLQQLADRLGDLGRAEERGDELGGAVGLVAAGETARDHDDLALADAARELVGALGDGLGREVVDDQHRGVGAGAAERAGGVVLAVRAREDGDHDARAGDLNGRRGARDALLGNAEVDGVDLLALAAVREDGLDGALPGLLQLGQVNGLAASDELVGLGGGAQDVAGHAVVQRRDLGVVGELHDKAAVRRAEERLGLKRRVARKAELVADAHLEERLGRAAVAQRGHGERAAVANKLLDDVVERELGGGQRREAVAVVVGGEHDDLVARALELGGGHAVDLAEARRKRDERGRHVEVLEAAGHGVLAADGTDAEVDLRHEGAEDGGHGLAPALGLVAELLEVLLEREIEALVLEAGGHEAADRLDDGEIRAGELVGLHEVGVEAPRHAGAGGRLAVHGELGGHGHGGRELGLSAEGHEDGGGADGGVEALGEALVGRDVEVGDQAVELLGEGISGPVALVLGRHGHVDLLILGRAVGGEELAAHVDDRLAVPVHGQARVGGHGRDRGGLEVLLAGVAEELLDVFGRQGHGHALLGLGDGELGAVEALVLLGDGVEVDVQAVGQLADGDRDSAGAEVVAALDQAAGVLAAEEALELALHGRVALLDLGAVLLDGLDVVGLGGAGGAADAVAAGAPAEKHDDVAGGRALATHVGGGGSRHDSADLHALGHVAGVVELGDLAGGEADLVAVAGVAGRGGGHEFALGELALEGLGDGDGRVCGAGDAHGLVDVAAAGERVADGAADAGGRAAEGLDLGRVVVGLVLKEVEPVLLLAVDVDLALDGAGVDLLGLVEVLEDALGLEVLGADGAHVHKADGLLVAAELVAHGLVAGKGVLDARVAREDVVQARAEGGVAAVVGPVGVDHLDLGDGRHAALAGEVLLAELDVGEVHGQAAFGDKGPELLFAEREEVLEDLDRFGLGDLGGERLARLEAGLAGLDRVDHVVLDGVDVGLRELALEHVDLGGANRRALAL